MGYYTVMLVDDEKEVGQAIIRKLNWHEVGFEVIGYAENGEEALELAENLRPDVVMTDIHMPFMDGLTLCRRLKEFSKNTRIIIFSGYDEFEYAREAIQLGAEEYILKPIDAAQLKLVFERIRGRLDAEIEEKRNLESLKKYYFESLPVMREQFLGSLLEGKVEEERIGELVSLYDPRLHAPLYMVTVLHADPYGYDVQENHDDAFMYTQLLPVSQKKIVEENLDTLFSYRCFLYLEWVVVIALLDQNEEIPSFINCMDQICKIISKILGVNASAGIGQPCKSLEQLSHSYSGAKNAFEYRILFDQNQAIYIQDMEPRPEEQLEIDENEIAHILREMKVGSRESLQKAIEQVIGKVRKSQLSISQFQLSLMEIFVEIIRLARAYDMDMEAVAGENFNLYQDISRFSSLEEIGRWLTEICLKVRSRIRIERTDSAKSLAEKAIAYINEHYSNKDLSVEVICNALNVSAAYFSTIFKKETGMGFVNYLTKVRLEQALRLLNTTSEKAYTIAGQVGYAEPNYFSYVFKKEYGMSPSKYRTSQGEQHERKN